MTNIVAIAYELLEYIKNIAINIILMEYERNSHSVKIKSFIKENDLQTCMRRFLIDDEFKGNAIRSYYKANNQNYNVNEVSSKYQILLRLKKMTDKPF